MRYDFNKAMLCALALVAAPAAAQIPVVGVAGADALFSSPDPRLQANKQVAYHIVKDLEEAGHWELADRYISDDYIQHSPQAKSGRDAVVKFFREVLKSKPIPIPEKMKTEIVAVVAENDLVLVVYPYVIKDPRDRSKSYATAGFDLWRIKDGKAVEHWDPYSD